MIILNTEIAQLISHQLNNAVPLDYILGDLNALRDPNAESEDISVDNFLNLIKSSVNGWRDYLVFKSL